MESFVPDDVKAVLLALLAIGFVLAWLARRFPGLRRLQVFRLPAARMSRRGHDVGEPATVKRPSKS